ncbi:phospholipase D-like domain-containing protein [Desulfococcaceae bacterium HSG9]|nr:phospholipase D-like domain-containing protein [Desulfococcaceae bacterium HSG9]
MIKRFSSRRSKPNTFFIDNCLNGAVAYDRIAGYFRSSMLEIAGEKIEAMNGKVRVVCNSDIDVRDVETAKAARQALRKSWCAGNPEQLGELSKGRFLRLHRFITEGKLEIRVLPDEAFGLIHGKTGVITYKDGRQTCFMGSANESFSSWQLNYELIWEDNSASAIQWVQDEFDALWFHHLATPLSDFVVCDIKRLACRSEITIDDWKQDSVQTPASGIIETPVFRREYGLWPHQKYFIKLAYDAHLNGSARFILADQVGLGKTVQLALSAMLMALHGQKPVLVIAPKTLLPQWQEELFNLLGIPSAVWNGNDWIDEQGIVHPSRDVASIRKCPRKIGLISQGLITSGSASIEHLKTLTYECIIVDEAHRARRKKINAQSMFQKAEPNNLMRFLLEMSPLTESMLLATATPVQIHLIEAWDLLNILAQGNDMVMGAKWSEWRKPDRALSVVTGETAIPDEPGEAWRWIRNPMPPASEGVVFKNLRRTLGLKNNDRIASGDSLDYLRPPEITRLKSIIPDFGRKHSVFIRHIVRRTRDFLENTVDPSTGEPYLKPVKVVLFGESPADSLALPLYLQDAYEAAEQFCKLLGQRAQGAGFLKTLLLRRIGSTIYAGRRTTEKMLNQWGDAAASVQSSFFEEEDDRIVNNVAKTGMKVLTAVERVALQRCLKALENNQESDPKYMKVIEYLIQKNWIERGCIIFSQYFDSIKHLADQLSMDMPDEPVGVYAGGANSGIITAGQYQKISRDILKRKVGKGKIRILLGTEAASEGLNLQKLGALINLDLPWNPTRLEQRKGRIQRIGQLHDEVYVYNMRYQGSVEDRVHELLSGRLEDIHALFGQIPDVLEDVWIEIAIGKIENAKKLIDSVKPDNPFDERYNRISAIDWESCSKVLNADEKMRVLMNKW